MKSENIQKLRKKLFVSGRIQGRLLSRVALYWLGYHVVLSGSMFLFRYAEHRGRMIAGVAPRTLGELYGEFVHQNIGLWVVAIAAVPIVLWDLLTFSHRIVGPLTRFKKALETLTSGQRVSEIRLRDGDLLTDLSDSFNRYLASLHSFQHIDIKTSVENRIAPAVSSLPAESESQLPAVIVGRDSPGENTP